MGFPYRFWQYNHETLYNLTDIYYSHSTDSYCVPADSKSIDLTIPCIDLGSRQFNLKEPLSSLYGLEFNGTTHAIFQQAHSIFNLNRLWTYVFEIYFFDTKNKQYVYSRYTNANQLW